MLKQITLIALMGLSASAMAYPWQVKVGASSLAPTGDTEIAPGLVVEADQEYGFTPSVEYFFNDNISAELLLAALFNHDISAQGLGKLPRLSIFHQPLPQNITLKTLHVLRHT